MVKTHQPEPRDPVSASEPVLERRKSDRIPVFQEVAIAGLAPCATSLTQATAVNISLHGMGLVVAFPFSRGSFVKIHSKDAVIFGEVRHCRRTGKLFHIGVSVETVASRRAGDQQNFPAPAGSSTLRGLLWRLFSSSD